MDWRLRRAGADDAPALAAVAAATFLETFAGVLTGPDILAHVARNSSAVKFAGWAESPDSAVTIAEHPSGGAPVGYALMTPPDFPIDMQDGDVELRRIYALSLTRGTGLGHALMARAVEDALALGGRRMLIGVLGTNRRARDFYEREGFVLFGERRFLVGDTWHDDVVYGRAI